MYYAVMDRKFKSGLYTYVSLCVCCSCLDAGNIPPELLKKYQEAAGDHQKKPQPKRSASADIPHVANAKVRPMQGVPSQR